MRYLHNKPIENIIYRRNGVSGRGFWTGTTKDEETGVTLMIIRPEEPKDKREGVECYVISPGDLDAQWRGDCFNTAMDKAIEQYRKEQGYGE